ncbi:hypothetical protein L3X39_10085 [Sabulilitoribacter multivorans]|uniref:Uncharacterized protein n=1 Tax=Flaviramulus multivorans TaxID=1304750 RepID=A0ABS9IK56_9FLAO|nr:DUF6134 family protein [Flaviramulus multivorans]MCF7560984.1 hypothetical protein [Flaviramulus multivorans]
MIPALILYLIRRFKRKSDPSKGSETLNKLALKLKSVLFFAVIACSFAFTSISSSKALKYHVVKNNEVIGTIKISKNSFEDSIVYNLESNIKTKFLLKFNITGKEKSIYKKGLLVYSSVFRTLNNKTKVNHKIIFQDGQYNLQSDERLETLNFNVIKQNLITLYFDEPLGINTVFCDNLKEMVTVNALGGGKYKVDFSSGKHNIFHYNNGKCIKVEAVSTLFNVTLIPVKS